MDFLTRYLYIPLKTEVLIDKSACLKENVIVLNLLSNDDSLAYHGRPRYIKS